jgi:hypothetical protein
MAAFWNEKKLYCIIFIVFPKSGQFAGVRVKSSEESVMIRHEQEQAQKRTTRPRKAKNVRDDEKLKLSKRKYI